MSSAAGKPALAETQSRRPIGWSWEVVLLLFVLASRLGPIIMQIVLLFLLGLLGDEIGLGVAMALFLGPALALLVLLLRAIYCWRRVRLGRRLVWLGLALLFALAVPAKELPWISELVEGYVEARFVREQAFLYGFRERVRFWIDVPSIRAWAKANTGLRLEINGPLDAQQLPASVRGLNPWYAASLEDSTAAFEGHVPFGAFHEFWILGVYQEDNPASDPKGNALTIAPGIWVASVMDGPVLLMRRPDLGPN